MRMSRQSAPTLALVATPLLVAMFGLDFFAASGLLFAVLAWRWGVTLGALVAQPTGPNLRLETIPASHFVEKVRWSLDRLQVEYVEVPDTGALGVFTAGRTVPRLRVRTGSVTSVIGNSSDILRYLWGRYGLESEGRADFLQPSAEAVELETRLDRYGVDLQRWIYYHILPHRPLTLRAWGAEDPRLPAWQRMSVTLLYPVLRWLMRRTFRLGAAAHERVVQRIEALLSDMEARLSDGRRSVLGGEELSFVDITLASLSGLWLQPRAYGAGKAEAERMPATLAPAEMLADIDRWRAAYPDLTAYVERLYRDERMSGRSAAGPASSVRRGRREADPT